MMLKLKSDRVPDEVVAGKLGVIYLHGCGAWAACRHGAPRCADFPPGTPSSIGFLGRATFTPLPQQQTWAIAALKTVQRRADESPGVGKGG